MLGGPPESFAPSGTDWLLSCGTDQQLLSRRRKKDSGRTRELGSACRGTLMRSQMEGLVQKALVGSGCLDLKDLELHGVLSPTIGGLVSIQCSGLMPLGPRAT